MRTEGGPGIETMRCGNQGTEQGKQDREASGEVGKTGVQGERETGDQPARSEKDEGETMINLEARIMKLEVDSMDVSQDR